jgi:ATP-dependent protease ClpP protease subunit
MDSRKATMSKLKDDVELFHDFHLHIPTRTIYLGSESSSDAGVEHGGESGVDHVMTERVKKNLHLLEQLNKNPITIILNSLGGDVYQARAIYHAIKKCKSPTSIQVCGQALSAGALILQAGRHRILDPGSRVMLHWGSISVSGEARTVYKWIAEYKRQDREVEQIFLERIRSVRPTFSLTKLRGMLVNDTILTAEQAVSLGLADEIEGEDGQ